MTRYVDNSEAWLRHYIDVIAPTVEAMGDLMLEEIQGRIQLQDEPSEPGEPIASPPPAHVLFEGWKKSRVSRKGDRISLIVYNRARTQDGESLVVIHEEGSDTIEPRPTVGPAVASAQSALLAIAQQGVR